MSEPWSANESRISIRLSPAQKALIACAARIRKVALSEFVLQSAIHAASPIAADELHIPTTREHFKRFRRLLDAPPAKSLRAMRRLLNEPSVLDE
jgi:uncharacterized protein (DUF1778 family)